MYDLKPFFLFFVLLPFSYALPSLTCFCTFLLHILLQLGQKDVFPSLGHLCLVVICDTILFPDSYFCQGWMKAFLQPQIGLSLLIWVETTPMPRWSVLSTPVRLLEAAALHVLEGVIPLSFFSG